MSAPCCYCGNECPDRMLEFEHRPDCAFETNLWPVIDQDLASGHGFGCLRCDHQFALGEYYTTVEYTDDEDHTHDGTVEVVCLSCAFASVTA